MSVTEITQIKRRFFHSLKRGTGEAYLIARDHPTIDFSNYLIKAALTNFGYDCQSEGSRSTYVLDIISISKNKEKIRSAILKGLATEQEDTWNLVQLFELAKYYALQGDQEAKQSIYQRFLHNPIEGSDWAGAEEIMELDGLEGLLHVAEEFGKFLVRNPDDWQDDHIVQQFQNDHPSINAWKELEKAAETNQYIRLYLDEIEKTRETRRKYKPVPKTFDGIIDEVLRSSPFLRFWRRKELSDADLTEIGQRLLTESNPANVEKLIHVFTYQTFPFDSDFILRLAKRRASSKNRINEFAISALKHLKSEGIREFALKRMTKTRTPSDYTNILVSNYQSGDHKLLSQIAKRFKNEHIIESLASSYSAIFSRHHTAECQEPLEVLYSKMNCGIHRKTIVKILMENGVLSDVIKEEIPYDSYLPTRALLQTTKS